MEKITIHFGALADPIGKQLSKQGLSYTIKVIGEFQKDADAVTRLKWNKLIAEKEANKVRNKIYRKVKSHVQKLN